MIDKLIFWRGERGSKCQMYYFARWRERSFDNIQTERNLNEPKCSLRRKFFKIEQQVLSSHRLYHRGCYVKILSILLKYFQKVAWLFWCCISKYLDFGTNMKVCQVECVHGLILIYYMTAVLTSCAFPRWNPSVFNPLCVIASYVRSLELTDV